MRKTFLSFALSICIFLSTSAQLTLILDQIPTNTPAGDDIYIAGDFQGWNPGSSAHILTKDTILNIFHITLAAGIGDIQFKFTRGSWPKVESDVNGNVITNRSYSPINGDTLYLQIQGWEDLGSSNPRPSTAASNVHILTDSFYMPQLDRYRRIWLYLPPNYASTNYSYPVLYMHDGQNVFDASTSFSGEWGVDETLNRLHASGDTGIIVVAVDNGQNFRTAEYTPWTNPTYGGGDGDAYVQFIVDELKPFVDSAYRTRPGREHTGIMGSSLGALISTYAGIKHQAIFGKIGALSPAYWINPEIYGHVRAAQKQADMRIYQLGGSQEGGSLIRNMNRMKDSLLQAGFGVEELLTVEKADGQHSEWFWAREFEEAYTWLFRNSTTSRSDLLPAHTNFRLYPNPAQDELRLSFHLENSARVQIEIYDTLGIFHKSVQTKLLLSGEQEIKLSLDAWSLAPGFYICKLIIGRKSTSLKFVLVD